MAKQWDVDSANDVEAARLRVVEGGTDACSGVATLVAGTKVVTTSRVTANSRIQLTSNVDGGTPGWLRVSARSNGTSFTILSSSNTDTSQVAWLIVEPAADDDTP
jgi:O-acetylhomoserine/O-acetylserine sulfhydrylase-like pyridoxal-dependent enzyme